MNDISPHGKKKENRKKGRKTSRCSAVQCVWLMGWILRNLSSPEKVSIIPRKRENQVLV